MNEIQHAATIELQRANARYQAAEAEFRAARTEVANCERRLRATILADPASWRATPGVLEGKYRFI